MKMRYVLTVDPDGRAFINGGGHETDAQGHITAMGDYDRPADLDEILDGKRVRDYAPGSYLLKTFRPE